MENNVFNLNHMQQIVSKCQGPTLSVLMMAGRCTVTAHTATSPLQMYEYFDCSVKADAPAPPAATHSDKSPLTIPVTHTHYSLTDHLL